MEEDGVSMARAISNLRKASKICAQNIKEKCKSLADATNNFIDEAGGILSNASKETIKNAINDIAISLVQLGSPENIKTYRSQIPAYGNPKILPVYELQKICLKNTTTKNPKEYLNIADEIIKVLEGIQGCSADLGDAIDAGDGTGVEFSDLHDCDENIKNSVLELLIKSGHRGGMYGSVGMYEKYLAFIIAKAYNDPDIKLGRQGSFSSAEYADIFAGNFKIEVKHNNTAEEDPNKNWFSFETKETLENPWNGYLPDEHKDEIELKCLTDSNQRVIIVAQGDNANKCWVFKNAADMLRRCDVYYKGPKHISCRFHEDSSEGDAGPAETEPEEPVSESSKISLTYGQLVRLIESVNKFK